MSQPHAWPLRAVLAIAALSVLYTSAALAQPTAQLDREAIARAAGTNAVVTDDGVVRISWARDQVSVRVSGMRLPPPAGLGSWAAFQAHEGGALVMGDTVVFEDEITPAMDAALAHGLEVTALHNHFVFDRPPVYFMHIGGSGDAAELAAGVKAVWEAIRSVRTEHPSPREAFPGPTVESSGDIDAQQLAEILGVPASAQDPVAKFTLPRTGRMHGTEVGGSMGLATWAAFSGDMQQASVDGDFIMTAEEVQPTLRALRDADIHVVALHNHMIGEKPAFYFLHYWGQGRASELAQGLRATLDAQAGVPD